MSCYVRDFRYHNNKIVSSGHVMFIQSRMYISAMSWHALMCTAIFLNVAFPLDSWVAEHRGITRLELLLYIKDVHSDQFAWVLVDEVLNERANSHFILFFLDSKNISVSGGLTYALLKKKGSHDHICQKKKKKKKYLMTFFSRTTKKTLILSLSV